MNTVASLRKEYILQTLNKEGVDIDPIVQFHFWWGQAIKSEIIEVNAMTLATADKNGKPSARIVLLKGYDENGFVFFTNYMSHKALDLEENPQASLVFFWKELERQVRVDGSVSKISAAESDVYFISRPLGSKLGAWASPQSSVIPSREILEEKMAELENTYQDENVLRPPHWGGYIVKPYLVEFWQGRPNRLHDRIQYSHTGSGWKIDRLAP